MAVVPVGQPFDVVDVVGRNPNDLLALSFVFVTIVTGPRFIAGGGKAAWCWSIAALKDGSWKILLDMNNNLHNQNTKQPFAGSTNGAYITTETVWIRPSFHSNFIFFGDLKMTTVG
jgi:hypothetical protein